MRLLPEYKELGLLRTVDCFFSTILMENNDKFIANKFDELATRMNGLEASLQEILKQNEEYVLSRLFTFLSRNRSPPRIN